MNQWVFIGLNLFACGMNIGMSIRWFLRGRRLDREFDTVQQHFRTTIEELMPAVAFCAAVANADDVPDPIRDAARTAIPKGVTIKITEGPLVSGDSHRVH